MRMSYSCCMMLSSRKIQSILIGIMKNLRCKIKVRLSVRQIFVLKNTTFLFLKQDYPIHLFSSRGNRITATVKLPIHELNQNMAIRRPENIFYRDFKGKIAALENT